MCVCGCVWVCVNSYSYICIYVEICMYQYTHIKNTIALVRLYVCICICGFICIFILPF